MTTAEQPNLFDLPVQSYSQDGTPITLPPFLRRSETSRQAAIAMYPKAGTKKRIVLDDIAAQGEYGATDDEIQTRLRMPGNTERPRRCELLADGWIEDSGMALVTSVGEITARDVADYFGTLVSQAHDRLKTLINRGLLERYGERGQWVYRLARDAAALARPVASGVAAYADGVADDRDEEVQMVSG